ncbi:hypothetical protein BGX27_011558, partial [Mortierella sp. AM989]
ETKAGGVTYLTWELFKLYVGIEAPFDSTIVETNETDPSLIHTSLGSEGNRNWPGTFLQNLSLSLDWICKFKTTPEVEAEEMFKTMMKKEEYRIYCKIDNTGHDFEMVIKIQSITRQNQKKP